jgi:hypothetical protein
MGCEEDQALQDRRALEALTGRAFGDDQWPADAMPPGTRVLVIKDPAWDGPWRDEFTGTVDVTVVPYRVQNAAARPGELEYSVSFDEPQVDASGDGPYRKAVIWERYLRRVSSGRGWTGAHDR